jgi:tetratricopeptide (TPR) repeat protein
MTAALWQSAFMAALFGLHPLHVESVAWIAERKDVLSAFFGMLTILCYHWYVKRPAVGRYLPVFIFFALGLMAKPMLVTLPFVLLLLDFWPLRRFVVGAAPVAGAIRQNSGVGFLIYEKVPLLMLTAVSSVITFIVQQESGTVGSLTIYPFQIRIANALVSYSAYIGKMFWPVNLAVLYPHPDMLPAWQTAASCLLLIGISLLAIRTVRHRPYFAVGWLWYLGTLIPVIGLVQVGSQAMADRYTYVPLIGLFIIVAWGVPELLAAWRLRKAWLTGAAMLTLSALMVLSWLQVRYWKDSVALFEHTLNVTGSNHIIHTNLGNALVSRGEFDHAIGHYTQALRIRPDSAEVHNNLGVAFNRQGKVDKALEYYVAALRLNPAYVEAYNNLGTVRVTQGKLLEGLSHYHQALALDRDNARAHNNVGLVLVRQGKIEEAIFHFREALKAMPGYAGALNNYKQALAWQQKIDKAVETLAQALQLNPEVPVSADKMKRLQESRRQLDALISEYRNVLSLLPGFSPDDLNMNNYSRVSAVNNEYNRVLPLLKRDD